MSIRKKMSLYEVTKDAIIADLGTEKQIMEELAGRVQRGISEVTGVSKE